MRRGLPLEHGHVCAFREDDTDRVVFAARQIIPLQCPPQQAGLNAHHRIDMLIEVRTATESLDCDRVILDFAGISAPGLRHNKFQKGGLLR